MTTTRAPSMRWRFATANPRDAAATSSTARARSRSAEWRRCASCEVPESARAVLEFLMATARNRGYHRAILHAQLTAEGFYLKQGFRPEGEVFEEAGIPHRAMTRDL